jgi:hypothetical protein
MPPFHEDVLKALGVPASELQKTNTWMPQSANALFSADAYLWQHYMDLLVTGLDNFISCGVGSVGDAGASSSSSSSGARWLGTYWHSTFWHGTLWHGYWLQGTMQSQLTQEQYEHLMQQLPLGALQLLQHWPAMQLELLLLVDDIGCKVLLLQAVAMMLQVCAIADPLFSQLAAAKSALIQPLLQLVLPHVTNEVKQLRAAAGSSIAPHTSSGSTSSGSTSSSSTSSAASGSIASAAQHADAIEQALHAVLLQTINGGEQLLYSVSARYLASAACLFRRFSQRATRAYYSRVLFCSSWQCKPEDDCAGLCIQLDCIAPTGGVMPLCY